MQAQLGFTGSPNYCFLDWALSAEVECFSVAFGMRAASANVWRFHRPPSFRDLNPCVIPNLKPCPGEFLQSWWWTSDAGEVAPDFRLWESMESVLARRRGLERERMRGFAIYCRGFEPS